jgi:hypothetical protein
LIILIYSHYILLPRVTGRDYLSFHQTHLSSRCGLQYIILGSNTTELR